MARFVSWDSNLRMISLTLNPINPRIEHTFENSPRRILFDRGEGWWEGSATFGPVRDAQAVGGIEAFFAALNEGDCYTSLPLTDAKLIQKSQVGSLNINRVGANGGVQTSRFLSNDSFGTYWHNSTKQNTRMLVSQTFDTFGTFNIFQPNRLWEVGDTISPSTSINIRLNTAVNLPLTPHWAGGWTMEFTEWRARNVRT